MIKKLGFTLAEVLITLGIIGIVAILTVPNLIKDHQEQSWLTQSYVFNEKLIQALRVMNTQQVLAGAAIHCGWLSKLPTKEDLQALAPKLYKNNKPNFYYQDLIDRNKASIFLDKVTPFNNTQLFVIWGNTFKDAYDAAYLNVFIGTAEYNAGHNYVRSSAWENRSFTLCKL